MTSASPDITALEAGEAMCVDERDGNGASDLAGEVPSKSAGGAGVGIGASRRGTAIRPKEAAGSVVWAKLAKYPWWPAQVLDPEDPWIPQNSETPRHGAIPVRFFGTYDFAWIENQRAVCQYESNFEEHSSSSKQKVFMDSMAEASRFQETGELPNGFNEDDPSPQKPARRGKGVRGRGKKGDAGGGAGARTGKRGPGDGVHRRRGIKDRQEAILRGLGLVPPPDSPFAHTLCLDGVRELVKLKEAGRWPPPHVPLQQQTVYGVQYPTTSVAPALPHQLSHMTTKPIPLLQAQQALQAQHAQQLQYQQQQFHQQIQQQIQHQQNQPWYLQQAFNPQQTGLNFFGGQGGVQGALMAAAGHAHQYSSGSQLSASDAAYAASQLMKGHPQQ